MNFYPTQPYKSDDYEFRSKEEYPYSYSPIILFGQEDDNTTCVYSDRIEQWDRTLTDKLYEKHMGKNFHGDYSDADPVQVEAFLKERLKHPNLKLITVVEWCNPSNGYPYWSFYYTK